MQNACDLFRGSLSADEGVRVGASRELEKLRLVEGFATSVMQVFQTPGAGDDVYVAAALFIKNIARQCYSDNLDAVISEADKVNIKKSLIATFLQASSAVRKILQEAITLICENDFPLKWPGVLNDVVQQAEAEFVTKSDCLEPLLSLIHSVLGKYRDMYELTEEIKNEVMPLTESIGPCIIAVQEWAVAALRETKQDDVAALEKLLRVFLACVSIFVDLNLGNCIDMSPYFEDNLARFMTTFLTVLQYSNAKLETPPTSYQPGTLNLVRAEVIDLLTRFLKLYDDEFEPFMQHFAQAVWAMLEHNTTLAPKHDELSITSMDFLAATARSIHHQVFKEQSTLSTICTSIVIPNISVRDSDLQIFEHEPREYIAGDIEGSDLDTRRHSACQLIQALCSTLEAVAAPIFKQHIGQLLAQYEEKGDWRAKSAAIYLVTALGCVDRTPGSIVMTGVTESKVIDIKSFTETQVQPELAKEGNARPNPMLAADVIKFTISFRKQIPAAQYPNYIRVLAGWVLHPSEVVATYAASGIERMLNQDRAGGISKAEMAPLTSMLFQNLFTCLSSAETENHYVMMSLMRVIRCAQENVGGYIVNVLQPLVAMLRKVTKNPANPAYNHYMFESISALVKYNAPQVADIEEALFAPFAEILQGDVSEFLPYVFQIYAQMLELRSDIPACYAQLLPFLVRPELYANKGNVPAVVRFLGVFIEKDPQMIVTNHHLNPAVNTANTLCRSKTMDHDGFALLSQLLLSIPAEHLDQPMLAAILNDVFKRMTTSKTDKFAKMLVIFLGQVINTRGPDALVRICLSIQPNMWDLVYNKLWSLYVCKVDGDLNKKAVRVAFIRILTESEYMLAPERAADWAKGLQLFLDIMTNKEQAASREGGFFQFKVHDVEKLGEKYEEGYTNSYCPLACAAKTQVDHCANIAAIDTFFSTQFQALTKRVNIIAIVQQHLPPAHREIFARATGLQ